METATRPPGHLPGDGRLAALGRRGGIRGRWHGRLGREIRSARPMKVAVASDSRPFRCSFTPWPPAWRRRWSRSWRSSTFRFAATASRRTETVTPRCRTRTRESCSMHRFTGEGLRRESAGACCDVLLDEKYCSISALLPRDLIENRVCIDEGAGARSASLRTVRARCAPLTAMRRVALAPPSAID